MIKNQTRLKYTSEYCKPKTYWSCIELLTQKDYLHPDHNLMSADDYSFSYIVMCKFSICDVPAWHHGSFFIIWDWICHRWNWQLFCSYLFSCLSAGFVSQWLCLHRIILRLEKPKWREFSNFWSYFVDFIFKFPTTQCGLLELKTNSLFWTQLGSYLIEIQENP